MTCTSTKNSLFLFFFFLITSTSLSAQQNGGMEDWSSSGSLPPFDWKFPTGWTTTNATTEFSGAAITRSTDEHSGTYAAQLRTLNIFGTITRSQMALGNVKLDFPNYRLIGYTGGEDLSFVPNGLSFYYKLTTGDANEYAVADILIKRREAGDPYPDTVYFESVQLTSAASYTKVSVPFPTDNINAATDSIVIVFSSNDTNEIALNTLLIDDVSIDFASAVNPGPNQSFVSVYPNPVHANQDLHFTSSVEQLAIHDALGNILFARSKDDMQSFNLSQTALAPGLYYVRVNDEKMIKLVVLE